MPRWDINFDYNMDIDRDIIEASVKAEAHRQITSRIPIPPNFAKELDQLNIIRQIKGTTGLEGNPLTEEDVRRVIEEAETQKESGDYVRESPELSLYDREVKNAYEVQLFIRRLVSDTGGSPFVTEDLIRKLHYLSTKDIPSQINIPGQYRTSQVSAGDYLPPEHSEIPGLMVKFIDLVNDRKLIEGFGPLLRALVAHFYLISIHPFGDGNGRASRALEAYILYQAKFNARGFYSLANFFYRNRERYVEELQDARFKYDADLTHFAKFALGGLVQEIDDIQDRILFFVRTTMFLSYVNELYSKNTINMRCAALLEFLVKYKGSITIQQLRDKKDPIIRALYDRIKTHKTIQRDIDTMVKEGVLIVKDGVLIPNVFIMEQFEG